MIDLSIKKRLLIYNIFIQVFIISIFSFSVYKTIHLSALDKMETSLKVIILDILDDIIENQNRIKNMDFDEEKEYKFKPLYIRLLKDDSSFTIINSSTFPKELEPYKLEAPQKEKLYFKEYNSYVLGQINFEIAKKKYILQVATKSDLINETMENLFYILLFVVPIVLILAIIGGNFLVYRAFNPIELILSNLKEINSTTLSKRLKTTNKSNDEIDLLATEINSLLERLEISFDKINQFSSDASHELKTPLTIIRGEMEIALRKNRDIKEYQEVLKSSLDEIINIQSTIDDLLFLAKSEDNSKEFKDIIYIDEISIEAANELKTLANMKNIHLKVDIKEPFQISGHAKLLKVAIKNLIKNAIMFSHENGSVEIKNYIKDDNLIILVKDKGIGIPKEEQNKIFEKFYRTDKSRNKDSGGTGLGMSIVDKIVKIHKAKIELESQEDKGTTIKIVFTKDNPFIN